MVAEDVVTGVDGSICTAIESESARQREEDVLERCRGLLLWGPGVIRLAGKVVDVVVAKIVGAFGAADGLDDGHSAIGAGGGAAAKGDGLDATLYPHELAEERAGGSTVTVVNLTYD